MLGFHWRLAIGSWMFKAASLGLRLGCLEPLSLRMLFFREDSCRKSDVTPMKKMSCAAPRHRRMKRDGTTDGYRWMHLAMICIYPSLLSVSIQEKIMSLPLRRRERGRRRTDGSPQAHGRPGPAERRPRSGQARSAVPASSPPAICVDLCASVVPSSSALLGGNSAPRR